MKAIEKAKTNRMKTIEKENTHNNNNNNPVESAINSEEEDKT